MSRLLRFLACGAIVFGLCVVSLGQADFEIPIAETAPVIDGEIDPIWDTVSRQEIGNLTGGDAVSGPTDCSGHFRALYDPDYLYVLIDVNDEDLQRDGVLEGGGHNDDSAEFYFDGNNSKGDQGQIDENDFQYRVNWNTDQPDNYYYEFFHQPESYEGVEAMMVGTDTGYRFEVRFPWSTLMSGEPAPMGELIGIDCFINDDDGGGDRSHQIAWHATEGAGWNTPAMWGTAKLIAPLKATSPNPKSGADDVLIPLLRWQKGRTAVFHDVYFGATPELGPEQLVSDNLPMELYYHMGGIVAGTTYYWRVDEVEIDGVTTHMGDVWNFMVQPLTAYKPQPEDGSNTVPLAPDLAWVAGTGAVNHQVYFSDAEVAVADRAASADKGAVEDPNFAPGDLAELATYYWAVDELGISDSVVPGDVWIFSTVAPVDTFEDYTDDIDGGQAIFLTWIDGVDNGTGSTVGYWEAANGTFGETTVVYGGLQSMPLDYNNVNAPYYSETTRTFAPAENWTGGGAGELVLYIRGRSSNDVAPLYIGVNDAVVVHPEAEIVKTLEWAQWKIPFSALTDAGANLASVRSMTIGVGDRANPVPGAQGQVYIDEIALALPTPVAE